ncbi:CinA family protein [Asticcacaulis sp. 201]|uniref:CinA family protein n=1 Tax=Asticcacaulis sp. 201 TaxID=3028787 RepID=UPI0029167BAD|nr:CinA family protein [Asticcacaulis sp. 201]MDV6329358.1 CinA family protein [Asticcacaulis sp. 201]
MTSAKLAAQLIDLLKRQKKIVTTVESCTGGLIAGAITGISGSSEVFEQGFITYSNAAKTALVYVPEALLKAYGAVSIEVAASMAEGALTTAGADIALSVTGIAGPTGGSAEKPVGMVCFGLSYLDIEKQRLTLAQVRQFGDIGREAVRQASVEHALQWAIDTLSA